MKLSTNGTSIFAGTVRLDQIDPARARAVLIAEGRHPLIAHVLAHGGFTAALQISAGDARLCGADIGLLTKEPR
jgi:hypothetical protein